MKIGIFDSGIGGLSVLHLALRRLQHAQFIYYADAKHVPYGEKTEEEIRGYVAEVLHFMAGQGVDAVMIACNTATSVATKEFRAQFPMPIVGMEPAVKMALEKYQGEGKRVLVAATPVTIAGKKLHMLLEQVDREHLTDLIPLPGLVHFAERGEFDSCEVDRYLKQALKGLDLTRYGTLVLGCTHFNYFKEHYRKVFPCPIHLVDGNEGAFRQLLRLIPEDGAQEGEQSVSYYISGRPADEQERERIGVCFRQLDKMYRIR